MTTNLAEHLLRHAIGFDGLVRSSTLSTSVSFPPYNIEQVSDDLYRLTLAVAGYSREDITIAVHQGNLVIKGERAAEADNNYIHRGIALRDFVREWKLGEHINVVDAGMENGLLTIDLERVVPEEAKPKQILIR